MCSRIVQIAEFDERRPVQEIFVTSRKLAKNPLGSGYLASCWVVTRTLEADSAVETSCFRCKVTRDSVPFRDVRRKPNEADEPGASRSGGGSTCRGKASWFHEPIAFDEALANRNLAACLCSDESRNLDGCDRRRQRLRKRARCAADNAVTGRPSAEELRSKLPRTA